MALETLRGGQGGIAVELIGVRRPRALEELATRARERRSLGVDDTVVLGESWAAISQRLDEVAAMIVEGVKGAIVHPEPERAVQFAIRTVVRSGYVQAVGDEQVDEWSTTELTRMVTDYLFGPASKPQAAPQSHEPS